MKKARAPQVRLRISHEKRTPILLRLAIAKDDRAPEQIQIRIVKPSRKRSVASRQKKMPA
jgi:hypothetical protein